MASYAGVSGSVRRTPQNWLNQRHIYIYIYVYISYIVYIYIYIYTTHTHTYIYIYIIYGGWGGQLRGLAEV